jgi:predicted metallo-beta-lactamase superfamily hydrolase
MSSGAPAYYLGYILHDYSDEMCRKILSNIVAAIKPGYSKLLIIHMLAVFSGMERTKTQLKELLASVGLEIIKFWSVREHAEGLIEAVKKA